ncbi:hypothetical protein GCM10012279_31770 [Micromonospora yangpuensis]|nr:hypothetical protein GCM10012279_31770 [Micromonospora yangpuensis]
MIAVSGWSVVPSALVAEAGRGFFQFAGSSRCFMMNSPRFFQYVAGDAGLLSAFRGMAGTTGNRGSGFSRGADLFGDRR